MKKAIFIVTILFVAVMSTACINNMAVQELNNAAKSYMDKGDYQSAIERLESSIELDNSMYETHYNLGVAYIEAQQYQKAVDSFTNAQKINPKYANTYYSLAIAQEKLADSLINANQTGLSLDENDEVVPVSDKDAYNNASSDVKEQMIEIYLNSINNFQKYIEIINSPQKADEINNHIKDIEEVLARLGYKGSGY